MATLEYTSETEETEETEDTEETEETEEIEDTEDTEELENIDDVEEYHDDNTLLYTNQLEEVINKNINTLYNNNNFNKFQDELDDKNNNMIYLILNNNNNPRQSSLNLKKHPINKKVYKFYNRYNTIEKKFFDILPENDKINLVNIEESVDNCRIITEVPIRFKILNSDINIRTKKSILTKIESIFRKNKINLVEKSFPPYFSSLNFIIEDFFLYH